MASTKSKGLEYFSLSCIQSDELKFIKAKHTNLGYGLFISLLQKIHSEGYYIEWKEMNMYVFAAAEGVELNLLKEIVESCFETNLFDRELFEKYQILTSKDIQQRWQRAVIASKRKDIEIDPVLNLLDCSGVTPELLQSNPEVLRSTSGFFRQSKSNSKIESKKEGNSECASAHTHAHEESISVSENPILLEKNKKQNANMSAQVLIVEKREKEKNSAQKEKIEKVQVRERVYLTQDEIEQLKRELGEEDYSFVIDKLDFFKGSKGKNYKDDFCAIKNWCINALNEHKAKIAKQAIQSQPQIRIKELLSNHQKYSQKYS